MDTQKIISAIANRVADAQKLAALAEAGSLAALRVQVIIATLVALGSSPTTSSIAAAKAAAARERDGLRRHSTEWNQADAAFDALVALEVDLDPPQNVLDELARIEREKDAAEAAPAPAPVAEAPAEVAQA